MNDTPLPNDLSEIEQDLIGGRPSASPLLEARVLARVRVRLEAQRRSNGRVFALAAAAVLLVGLHISWQASLIVPSRTVAGIDRDALAARTRTIRALLPELSAANAERHALLTLTNGLGQPTSLGPPIRFPSSSSNSTLLH